MMSRLNQFRGAKAGCRAAEGFKSMRPLRAGQRSRLAELGTP
jgi:hypothetical protein